MGSTPMRPVGPPEGAERFRKQVGDQFWTFLQAMPHESVHWLQDAAVRAVTRAWDAPHNDAPLRLWKPSNFHLSLDGQVRTWALGGMSAAYLRGILDELASEGIDRNSFNRQVLGLPFDPRPEGVRVTADEWGEE